MIHKGKVALMTRLAIEEKNEPRFSFITSHFWFNDYITTEMWKSFFAVSLAYMAAVLFGLVATGDSWTVTYHIRDVIDLAVRLLQIWLGVVVMAVLFSLLSHVWLYREAFRKRERVRQYLRKLNRLYIAEEEWQLSRR